MKGIYEKVLENLNNKQEMVMATILEKSGSAPREEGTKMLIRKDLSIFGTIGGGVLEASVMGISPTIFETKHYEIEEFELSDNEASSIGMVCGGKVKVLLEFIDPEDLDMVNFYEKAVELYKKEKNFYIITRISKDSEILKGKDKWIYTENEIYGKEEKKPLKFNEKEFEKINFYLEDEQYLVEPQTSWERVYIFGAGHIGQKLADLMKMIGLYTVVVDDREEFANKERFPFSEEVKVMDSYKNINEHLIINNNSYIIIVTRGHSFDKEVLSQVLRTDAKYIGMIGSIAKRDHIYSQLINEGFAKQDLERVFSPIGLNIHAQTPEEIAISIVAEIIEIYRG